MGGADANDVLAVTLAASATLNSTITDVEAVNVTMGGAGVITATNITGTGSTVTLTGGGAGTTTITGLGVNLNASDFAADEVVDAALNASVLDGATSTLTGGSASDTLTITGGGISLSTAELANVTGWESWTMAGAASTGLFIHDNNVANGATLTIDTTSISATGTITLDASAETDGTVNATVNSSIVDGGTPTLKGGQGSSDTLTLTGAATFDAGELANLTLWETWTLGTDAAYSLTLNDANAGGGTLTINAAAVTTANNLTLNASAETAGTINATIAGSVVDDSGAHTLTGGQGSSDNLTINTGGALTLDGTELGSVTAWETWTLASNQAYTLTLDTANAGAGALTVDASALTASNTLNLNAAAETNGGTLSVTMNASVLDGATSTLTGGSGSDTLTITGGGISLSTAELANVTGWESWTMAGAASTGLFIHDNNVANGATLTIDTTSISATGTITLDASAEADGTVNATISSSMLDGEGTGITLTGGQGASDTLTFSGGGLTLDATELGNISAWETWTLGTDAAYSLTLVDGNIANSATLTIDGAAVTTGGNALTVNASAESDGVVNITGGAGADAITGGSGADTLTGGGGADALTGGGGQDTFVYNAVGDFGDTISDFLNSGGAPAADLLDFAAGLVGANLRGAGTAFQSGADVAALNADTGLFVNTTAEATLNTTNALTHANTLTGGANLDIFYMVLSDNTNGAVYRISETNSSGDGVFDSAELVANLTDINTADVTALDGTSFTDFA